MSTSTFKDLPMPEDVRYVPPLRLLMLKDPTVWFTIFVLLVPLVFVGVWDGIAYLLHPTLWMSFAYLVAVLHVTHGDGKSFPLSERDQRVAYWFLMNGVYFNLFLDVFAGQFQMFGELSRRYLQVDPRYAIGVFDVRGQSVFMTSMLEIFAQSPLSLVAYYAYCRKKPYRYIVEFTVCILHSAGVWWFYFPEAIAGFEHLGGWPKSVGEALSFDRLLFFWFGFWFCGILWLVVPFHIAKTAWINITRAMAAQQEREGAKKLD